MGRTDMGTGDERVMMHRGTDDPELAKGILRCEFLSSSDYECLATQISGRATNWAPVPKFWSERSELAPVPKFQLWA